MAKLNYSKVRAQFGFTLTNEEGVDEPFVCLELTGQERDKHQKGVQSRSTIKGETVTVNNQDGLIADVIDAHCYTGVLDPNDIEAEPKYDKALSKKIGTAVIQTWPSTTQLNLYHKCLKLSGLDKDSMEAAAKN